MTSRRQLIPPTSGEKPLLTPRSHHTTLTLMYLYFYSLTVFVAPRQKPQISIVVAVAPRVSDVAITLVYVGISFTYLENC